MEDLILVSPKAKAQPRKSKGVEALPDLDNFKYYIVSCSGGKDSQASVNVAIDRFGKGRVKIVFCEVDTEDDGIWEFKENIEHINYLEQMWGIPIARVQARERAGSRFNHGEPGLTSIILHRGFQPGATMAYCSQAKRNALDGYVEGFLAAENLTRNDVCVVWGQRGEESPSRAKLPEYNYDLDAKHFIWRPVHKWSEAQVFEDIARRGQLVNPVYFQQAIGQRADKQGRANCKFCHNAPNYELRKAVRRWPEAAARYVEKIEKVIGPRRDYSVAQAIIDVAMEDATPDMFADQDLEEREMMEFDTDRRVCGVGNSWYSCEV